MLKSGKCVVDKIFKTAVIEFVFFFCIPCSENKQKKQITFTAKDTYIIIFLNVKASYLCRICSEVFKATEL